MPKFSIVILSYNNFEKATKLCIASVLENTSPEDCEIIIVDNGSTKDTIAKLETIASNEKNVRLLANRKNLGYAAGNNVGIRESTGEFVVLLNNDALIGPNFLTKIHFPFTVSPKVGLVGPITNSCGNEQRIELPKLNSKNFSEASSFYTSNNSNLFFKTARLGFFCVAISRQAIEKVGLLDEKFGLGMFEDDDYCLRAQKNGFELVIAEDCFVYHFGSVSFSKLSSGDYSKLFNQNKLLFSRKHKADWTLGEISLRYWERFDMELRLATDRKEIDKNALDRILFRWPHFRDLLVNMSHESLEKVHSSGGHSHSTSYRSKWRLRWFYFKKNVVSGTPREKKEYFFYIAKSFARRSLGLKKTEPPPDPFSELLEAINQKPEQKIFVFPETIDYSFMKQRPQQLADAISKLGHLVLYGTRNHVSDDVQIAHRVEPNLYLVNSDLFVSLAEFLPPKRTVYFCIWPTNHSHLDYLLADTVIYDFVDDLSILEPPLGDLEKMHLRMLKKASQVFVSSSRLVDTLPPKFRSKATLLPNAVSNEFIQELEMHKRLPRELEKKVRGKKVVGYYGAIESWMDFSILRKILKDLERVQVVLIGPVNKTVDKHLISLKKFENFIHVNQVEQKALIPFLQRFDVCVIPFKVNKITDAISPVKLYEYLAAGKPVISSKMEVCEKIDAVSVASSKSDFVRLVEEAIIENSVEKVAARKEYAKHNTWEKRAREILRII